MKESKKLENKYAQLRSQLIAEISLAIKLHKDIEVEPEFRNPISYAVGMDEQDEHQLIEQVDFLHVTIFHQGNEIEKVKYENLNTEILIELLKGLEISLDEAKKFLDK